MAIIYSYPVITPTADDLLLGTDQGGDGKPTKNFTIQSIVDLVAGGATGLGAVIEINSSAKNAAGGNQSATDFLNISGTGSVTFASFTDGNMTVTNGIGTGFVSISSTNFVGNLTGRLLSTGQASQIASGVQAVTQAPNDNSTKIATTAYVDTIIDPSILTFTGTTGGNQTVTLVNQTFSLLGTANQIESTSTGQTIRFNFPAAGVVLPDGSTATTQALTDNSTDVATTAFVHGKNNEQDLDFIGDTGTSSVLLNSQTLDFEGTALQVTTAVTAQKVKFSLPASVTIGGTFTGTTFAGDLLGTINTATTGITQPLGNDTTKIATTAFVERAAGAKTLQYQGDTGGPFDLNLKDDDLDIAGGSNISTTAATVATNLGVITIDLNDNVTISGTSKADTFTTTAGTATWVTTVLAGFTSITSDLFVGALTGNASTATALATAGTVGVTGDVSTVPAAPTYTSGGNILIDTTIADTVVTGKILTNLPTPTVANIAASDTILAAMAKLQGQITGIPQGLVYKGTWNANTNTPTLASGVGVTGEFYIVSVAGTTNLDGITDWQIGDWAIFVEVGATDTWQKIDNTSAILGSGTANKIAKWTGSNTLATGLIEDNGTLVTIGNSGSLLVEGNTTLGDAVTDTTTVVGPATMQSTARFNVGISLGAATYGTAGQVLTSGGGAASVNTWTTPTVGTVTSVGLTETGNALTITGSPVTSSGTINIAGAGSASQYINGALDLVTFPTVDNYVSWTADSDQGTDITVTSGFNLKFTGAVTAGGAGIATDSAVSANEMTIGLINAGGTPGATTFYRGDGQWSVPVGTKTETLAEVLTNGNTTGGTDIAVGAGDDITFTDTSKALFGTGGDLKIYHDGTNGYVDNTTGAIIMRSPLSMSFRVNTTESAIVCAANSSVELFHDNNARLTTTGSGVTVTGAGTFTGAISAGGTITCNNVGNDKKIAFRRTGSNNFSIEHDSAFIYFYNETTSSVIFKMANNNDATFTGNVEIDGNLTVDGNIIHGGTGNGGTYNFSDTVNATSNENIFSIQASNGAQAFTVYFTCNTSGVSVAKVYTVVHSYGATVVYNKLVDSGPYGGVAADDFTPTFTGATDTVTCNIANLSSTNLNIVTTVVLGGSPTTLTVTAL